MVDRSHYHVLGVPQSATQKEIRQAYQLLASMLHPDRFDQVTQRAQWEKANAMLAELNTAFSILRHPLRRAEYDRALGEQRGVAEAAAEGPSASARKSTTGEQSEDAESPRTSTPADNDGPLAQLLHFSDLQPTTREGLLGLQRDPSRRDVSSFPIESPTAGWVSLAIPFGWFAYLLIAANAPLWSRDQRLHYLAYSIGSSIGLSLIISHLLRHYVQPLKPSIHFTPFYVIRTRGDIVEYWPTSSVRELKITPHINQDGTSWAAVKILLPGVTLVLIVQPTSVARALERKLEELIKEARVRSELGDREYLDRWGFFAGYNEQSRPTDRKPLDHQWRLRLFRSFAVPLVGALAGWFCFGEIAKANDYHDDHRRWDDARALSTATALRGYISVRPQGRFRAEAERSLDLLYQRAGAAYNNARKANADAAASAAVLGALHHAHTTGIFSVRLVFEGRHEIPIEAAGASNIIPIGDAFSNERMTHREEQIADAVGDAFRQIIPEDVLSFTRAGYQSGETTFSVSYTVTTSDSLYYRELDAGINAAQRPHYRGIEVHWTFRVRVPPSPWPQFRFELDSRPAARIMYRASTLQADAVSDEGSIYDAMAQSAFDDFKFAMIRQFGLRVAPKHMETGPTDNVHRPSRKARTPRQEKYLFDLLKDPAYRRAWDTMLSGQQVDDWLRGYADTLAGVSGYETPIKIDGVEYQPADVCKPHDCGDNRFVCLFAPRGEHAWGLLVTTHNSLVPEAIPKGTPPEVKRFFGHPSLPLRAALKKLMGP